MFFSFLGLGQAGGNVAEEAAKRGYYSAAINFSQVDLDSLNYIENKLRLIGSEGIGKQRKNAISLMSNNWDLATNFVKENFSHPSIEIIFVPFSTSGGSGSGIAPVLLSLLTETMTDKVFVAMPILPDRTETYVNQRNCIETFEDISKLDICILPIDNDKAISKVNKLGKNLLYKNVNKWVIDMIDKILLYTEKQSNLSVIDKKDLKAILQTPGLSTISEVDISSLNESINLSTKDTSEKIRNSWNSGLFANIEEKSHIVSAGFIFDGQEKLMSCIDVHEIYSNFNNKMPLNLFEGLYLGEKGKVISILAGLSWENKRFEKIKNLIMEIEKTFDEIKMNREFDSKITSETNNLTSISAPKQKKVNDISSIIKKFKR